MDNIFDVVIIGGGVSGCSCAWNSAKRGLKTLLIEKKSYLGGAISGGLVLPMMKTQDKDINVEFYNELIKNMQLYDAQITYGDGNKGWFNPEMLKMVLEEMLTMAGVKILYNSDIYDITTSQNASIMEKLKDVLTYNNKTVAETYNDKKIKSLLIKRNVLSYYVEKKHNDKHAVENFKNLFLNIYSKNFVDASGDAIISELLNLPMQPDNDKKQPETLRFIMSNVDIKTFSMWLMQTDLDRSVTNVVSTSKDEFYLTTAYTWDKDKNWGLRDIFNTAIRNGDLEEEDTAYFQIFAIAKMPGAIAFNCPQIDEALPYEEKLISGRKAIYRLANFCKFYFPGFENAYISQISDELGVRVSNRPLAIYNYTVEDIKNSKTFKNPALYSDYPIDIHSNEKKKFAFTKTTGYELPIESLISAEFNNLYNIGKAIGADYQAQGALRVQKPCFSMGEAVAKRIAATTKQ